MKEFDLDKGSIAVAQLEVGDKERVLARKDELLEAMEALRERHGHVLVLLMITDIQREGTELLVAGRTRIAERAFNCTLTDRAVFLPGVMSRKKQVIPPLSGLL
jgi:manganese-dependent inorganic pyrophosphatase